MLGITNIKLTFLSFCLPLSDQANLETSFEHLDLADGDNSVAFDFGRNAEQQLVREQQPNSKQSLIESHDSGFSFEKSPSQTKFARPSQPPNETIDPLYKAKTIKKRSHPSRNIRRQFKLDSLDCSFDDSLNTISSVDSNKPESATENSNSFDLEDENSRPASDLNKVRDQRDAQHDRSPNASERANLDEKKGGLRSDSSRRGDKKAYLISKEEFKKRISSESVHLPDHKEADRFEENGKKRNKSRGSKKQLKKQASSTISIAVKPTNQSFPSRNYRKSSSTTSLNDEQAIAKSPNTTTRTISSLKNQMLDIVNSVSRSPDERLSDRSSGKSSCKSSDKSSDNLGDKFDDRSAKKAGDKQTIKSQQNNLRNLVENTSTVTTKSVSSFKKAYLRTAACALENSSVFKNKKRNGHHRHHYNG